MTEEASGATREGAVVPGHAIDSLARTPGRPAPNGRFRRDLAHARQGREKARGPRAANAFQVRRGMWTQDSSSRRAAPLTRRNTRRKIRFVGPLVAADSESNLRTLRSVGASRAAPLLPSGSSFGMVGGLVAAVPNVAMHSPRAFSEKFGDDAAPPGLPYRRHAPELA